MMLISQNIILMPVKKKIVVKRNLTDDVVQSLGLHIHDLHHAHPPPAAAPRPGCAGPESRGRGESTRKTGPTPAPAASSGTTTA